MRALIVVHEPGAEPVLVGERLADLGYDIDEVMITSGGGDPTGSADHLGDPARHDIIAVMGSTHSLTDPDRISSWIHDELEFLRRADAAAVPVLGVCFGGQALAAAHGGSVRRLDRPQIGWFPQASHPSGLPGGPWMEWHHDGFEAPAGADVLVRDEWGPQAFTLRRNLALQFHPEVTPEQVAIWIGEVGDELELVGVSPDDLLVACEANQAGARDRNAALVDWFVSDVACRT